MEKVIKDLTVAENVSYEIGEESVSISIENADRNVTGISTIKINDLNAVEAFGYLIDLPDGLANGEVHRVQNSPVAEPVITLDVVDTTAEQFFSELHTELSSHGFVFDDVHQTGLDQPLTSEELFVPLVSYSHPDRHQFVIFWQDTNVIITLSE